MASFTTAKAVTAKMSQACNFIKKEILPQVFSGEFCEISKKIFFSEYLWMTALAAASQPPRISLKLTTNFACSFTLNSYQLNWKTSTVQSSVQVLILHHQQVLISPRVQSLIVNVKIILQEIRQATKQLFHQDVPNIFSSCKI